MTKNKRLLAIGLLIPSVLSMAGCQFKFKYNVPPYPFDDTYPDDDADGGKYSIKIWCDTTIVDLTKTQVNDFITLNQGKYDINLTVVAQSEGDAASTMLKDPEIGADIFCFAQDQLSSLKIAGAIGSLEPRFVREAKKTNSAGACQAATINGEMYGFPMTSDNGYYMYYDKRVVPESDITDMTKIIADCKKANKTINYCVFSNGFYSASYFMATGCYSHWDIDDATGKFIGYDDTYKAKGLPAMKALQELKKSGLVVNNDATNKLGSTAGVAISGIWNYTPALKALGDNLGCAPLPSFTVDGQSYHISSFSGYKLIGVKPSLDTNKVSVCMKIAQYLTSEKSQLERFNTVGWGPSNVNAAQNEAVQAQPGLKALFEQEKYAQPQVVCPGDWWSAVSKLASDVKPGSTEADFLFALNDYDNGLNGLLND